EAAGRPTGGRDPSREAVRPLLCSRGLPPSDATPVGSLSRPACVRGGGDRGGVHGGSDSPVLEGRTARKAVASLVEAHFLGERGLRRTARAVVMSGARRGPSQVAV